MHPISTLCRQFVLLFIKLLGIGLGSLVGFNLIMDPFHLYQAPLIEGVNKVKIELEKQNRLHKAARIARQKPSIIFLGSSRVMCGFDSQFLASLVQKDTYNGALADASFEETYHYFEHALYHQPHLKMVIVGLDLFAFNKKKKPKQDFSLERLKTFPLAWKDICSTLFTKDAIKSSLKTLKSNRWANPISYFLDKGEMNPEFINERKQQDAFDDLKYIKTAFNEKEIYGSYELDPYKIQLFYQMVKTCQAKGIELHAIICPTKAIYWEALYQKGLWPALEEWKNLLAQAYPIWDFSGFNCVTTSTWSKEDTLYFECSHFTPYVGNLILGKLLAITSLPASFGYLLTPESIQDTLSQIRKEHEQWQSSHSDMSAKIKQALEAI